MNTNRYFSFSRLGLVMKRDFMENWKTNLYLFLGVFLAFLGVYLLQMYDYNDSVHGGVLDAYQTVDRYVSHHTAAFAGIIAFLLFYFASETMRNMRTKEQRLSYLMLPATKLEKFVSRALYVTVGMFVMILLASLLRRRCIGLSCLSSIICRISSRFVFGRRCGKKFGRR